MTLSLKKGVRINGLKPEMGLGVQIVASVFAGQGKQAVITCGIDGKHSRGSKHYSGDATDWRTRHLTTSEKDRIALECKDCLGDDFDVVLESTHLHVEYHPKDPY